MDKTIVTYEYPDDWNYEKEPYYVVNDDNNNTYEEYVVINGKPELIGTTRVDLTNYVTITQLNNTIAALEARIRVLEGTESEVEVDPTDTSDINIWIQTK